MNEEKKEEGEEGPTESAHTLVIPYPSSWAWALSSYSPCVGGWRRRHRIDGGDGSGGVVVVVVVVSPTAVVAAAGEGE